MDTVLQLGTFVFRELEIPQQINFGGTQQIVQHDLIGGIRVIDALGKSDGDITWSGLMTGTDALSRAQTLNKLRANGGALTLKWFNLNYQVLIQSFTANTERFYQVAYEITLRVITDGDNPNQSQNLTGFNEAINSDFAAANTIANTVNIPMVTTTMGSLEDVLTAIPNLDNATPQQIATLTTPLNNAIDAVNTAIATPAANLFGKTQ